MNDRVPTNLRMLMILEAVANSEEPLTPTQINAEIGLPKQSIHRLCGTLLEEGFLIRDISGKRLRPSVRAIKLAQGLVRSRQSTQARRQVLLKLAAHTRETVNFVVPEDDGMTYIDRVETDWAFRIELPIGSRVPFHCTASGKCYLASLPETQRKKMMSAMTLEIKTPNTISDPAKLELELNRIANDGYAIDNEELFEGMVALSVPVCDENGNFLAAVAFHGPTQRLSRAILLDYLPTLKETARALASLAG